MLNSAHKGYEYQDLLSAYFVAQYIASNKLDVEFLFDSKDFDGDKFDDLKIYDGDKVLYRQIKHSENHSIEKDDFSAPGAHDLYLKDLFDSWLKQKNGATEFRLCLAWETPPKKDKLNDVLKLTKKRSKMFLQTSCYKIDCESLWPQGKEIIRGWPKLKKASKTINRAQFKSFLDSLIIEIKYPSKDDLKQLLTEQVRKIGIGIYPNDNLQVGAVSQQLQSIVQEYRADSSMQRVSAREIAAKCSITLNCGGIEEKFPIDEKMYVDVSDRLRTIKNALNQNNKVIATAEPGAGKSWLINALEKDCNLNNVILVRHYCYVSLEDSDFERRVRTTTLLGSLKDQIQQTFSGLHSDKTFAADVDEVNTLLNQIPSKTLVLIDGVDHVKRIYAKNSYNVTQKQIDVISAMNQLDFNNTNVKLLIISQPISEFSSLTNFLNVEIPPISVGFVRTYLKNANLDDREYKRTQLSTLIHEKSQGNALYCKYLVEHAIANVSSEDLSWLEKLPCYDSNLQSYYDYIYEKLDRNIDVPAALCGVDCSLNKDELNEITGAGKYIDEQLEILSPILRCKSAYGYSIYHESFKKYLFDLFEKNHVDVRKKVYDPLIEWLEKKNFYQYPKAYICLLKLYHKVEDYEKILDTISESFLEKSMQNACSFEDIIRNHTFQKNALTHSENIKDFQFHIILAEQSKMLLQIDHLGAIDFEDYIEAIKYNIGREKAHDFIQNFDSASLIRYMSGRSLIPGEQVYWELCNFGDSVDLEYTRDYIIMLLSTKAYQELDIFILNIYANHKEVFDSVLKAIDDWNVAYGSEWLANTPKIRNVFENIYNRKRCLKTAVDQLLKDKVYLNGDEAYFFAKNIEFAVKKASEEEIQSEITRLSNSCWFYDWIIFDILTSRLEKIDLNADVLKKAFSYLSKHSNPLMGNGRAIDLHYLHNYIVLSFKRALSLCIGNQDLLLECLSLLERVCSCYELFSRPQYLEILRIYVPEQYPISEQEKTIKDFIKEAENNEYYQELSQLYFQQSVLLAKQKETSLAQELFRKGVNAFWGYGERKDGSIYEILNVLTPYAKYTESVDRKILLDLYELSRTIVNHTDGSGTSRAPIVLFEKMSEIDPEYGIDFLTLLGLSQKGPVKYLEEMTSTFLRKRMDVLPLDDWFLICQSQPMLNSDSVLLHGLKNIKNVADELKKSFHNWIEQIPFISSQIDDGYSKYYSPEANSLYKETFGIDLPKEGKREEFNHVRDYLAFNATDLDESEKYFERNSLKIEDIEPFVRLLNSLGLDDGKKLLLQYVKSYMSYEHPIIEELISKINDDELIIFLCIGYFVFWIRFHETDLTYFKKAYAIDASKTMLALKQILGIFIEDKIAPWGVSGTIIQILIEVGTDKKLVQDHFDLLYRITAKKLPIGTRELLPQDIKQNEELSSFSLYEKIIILLITRLNRLCIEKSQHVIYALAYIAKTRPKDYISALTYIYSKDDCLLPICRAALLQIVLDYTPEKNISEKFKKTIKKIYPTGYYYEDYLISKWVDTGLDFVHPNSSITFPDAAEDCNFIPTINAKYGNLWDVGFPLNGSFKDFQHRRNEYFQKYGRAFTLSAERMAASHTGLSNAIYEIVNDCHYNDFKAFKDYFGVELISPFLLENIVRCVGAKEKKPHFMTAEYSTQKIKPSDFLVPDGDETWAILVCYEEEWHDAASVAKVKNSFENMDARLEDGHPSVVFQVQKYSVDKDYSIDKSILAKFSVLDSFENHVIRFFSPAAMKKMGLHINPNMFEGLKVLDRDGNVVAKMITWEENFYGSIWQGVEIPGRKGTALLFRRDKLELLEPLISNKQEL
jgi:hypothetical protein